MAWMIFDKLKLKPRIRQGRSTGAKILASIEADIPLINKVLEYRSVSKEKSTYVVGTLKLRDIDGRVRSNFSLHITATGRLSSKEPNVQNLPSANGVGNVRRAYVPPKGKILMEVDYSGAELRWLALLSNDRVLREIFIQGRNLHKETATRMFGPDFTPQQKMRAKAVNFGIPYGREAGSFKDEFNISEQEAQGLIDSWLDAYPEAKEYLQWCGDQVLAGKYLETPWGNRRRAGLVTKESLHALQNEFKNAIMPFVKFVHINDSKLNVDKTYKITVR
jgi:DNA polymerase-1